jgi:O-antigen/teichoic acid export membrane protein
MSYSTEISLKQRIFKASAWSFAGYGLSQAIRFGSNLMLTRLLAPDSFGVMAIATLVLGLLGMFSDVGLNLNVTQSKRGRDPDFLNTVWVIQIMRGVAICCVALSIGLVIFLAQRIGIAPKDSVYADLRLPYVIAVVSTAALIGGVQSTKVYEARRTLALGRVTRIDILSQLAGLALMFSWISIDRSVWALVAGWIGGALVSALLSHVWLPGVANRWTWDRSAFDEIINFGKWIFVSSILGFLAINGDRFVLAGLVGSTVFGVYVIAFTIFSSVDQVLGRIITDVSYPALSEIARDRRPDLKVRYYRFYAVIASCAYFSSGFFIISGQTLIGLIYDRRYEGAGWMLQILSIALMTVPFRLATQSFLIFGVPKMYSHIHAIRLTTLYISITIGFYLFGFPGAISGIVLAYFSMLPMTIAYSIKFGLFDLRSELRLLPVVFVGMIVAVGFNFTVDQASELAFHFSLHEILGRK